LSYIPSPRFNILKKKGGKRRGSWKKKKVQSWVPFQVPMNFWVRAAYCNLHLDTLVSDSPCQVTCWRAGTNGGSLSMGPYSMWATVWVMWCKGFALNSWDAGPWVS
jgi:hypothetical protein